jgi:hypothetical protein
MSRRSPFTRRLSSLITLAVAVLGSCTPESAVVAPVSAPVSPRLARVPAPPAPRLAYWLEESALAAISNDLAVQEYVDGTCGVWGTLNTQTTSRDALLDPDKNYKSNMGGCGPRFLRIEVRYADGRIASVNDGSYVTIGSVGVTAPGTARLQRAGFQLSRAGDQATGCAYVRYGYPGDLEGSDQVLITNTSDLAAPAGTWSWTVESTGAHRPVCWNTSGQKTLLAPMPFKLFISER